MSIISKFLNTRKPKKSELVGSTWEGFRSKGKVGYSLVDAAGE